MGFKTWAVGEVLTADDLMTYLMKQAVIVCTSSTRPDPPNEGMAVYETDTDRFKIHNGTTWIDVAKTDVANTFTAKQTISAGGLDVAGSPSGYHDELRFTSTADAGQSAITSLATGAATMAFDHRGTGNTGSWVWRNGTNAAAARMVLSGGGRLGVTGGIDVVGSPSGYNNEVRFNDTGADHSSGLSTMSTGSPVMVFDHRAASNTGYWLWRNGSSAATTLMTLTAAGALSIGSKLTAQVAGANLVAFEDNDAHTWEADGAGGWRFRNAWSTPAATFRFYGGDNTDELVRFADPSTTRRTSLSLFWKDASGTTRFQEVQTSASGDVDGTSRRYLYVIEI